MARGPREPRVDAKLKRAPKELQRQLWELRNPPDPEQKPLSFDALHAEVEPIFGFTVSAGSLSDWLAWYGVNDRLEKAAERKLQAQIALAKDPNLSPHAIAQASQVIFMAEALVDKDLKGYAILESLEQGKEKLKQGREKLDQGREKLKQQDRSLELEAQRIALLERKAAAADAAKTEMAKLRDPSAGLSDTERQAIIDKVDEILGLKS